MASLGRLNVTGKWILREVECNRKSHRHLTLCAFTVLGAQSLRSVRTFGACAVLCTRSPGAAPLCAENAMVPVAQGRLSSTDPPALRARRQDGPLSHA